MEKYLQLAQKQELMQIVNRYNLKYIKPYNVNCPTINVNNANKDALIVCIVNIYNQLRDIDDKNISKCIFCGSAINCMDLCDEWNPALDVCCNKINLEYIYKGFTKIHSFCYDVIKCIKKKIKKKDNNKSESYEQPKLKQNINTTTKLLPDPSEEQQTIINGIINNNNVIVDAVAGSGKTTTILNISKQCDEQEILLLTYNSKLKLECREKVNKLHIPNIEVHSYHSYCVKYYNHSVRTDIDIANIVRDDSELLRANHVDILILDEQQDMTFTYYKLVKKIIKDVNNKNLKIAIFGDMYQSIYNYNNANYRFLTWGDKLFNVLGKWNRYTISTSYRITNQMATFINNNLIGYNRITATKNGDNVRYIICNSFGKTPFDEIMYYLKSGYTANDIFVLAPSLKIVGNKCKPVKMLENRLVKAGVKCYAPTSDNETINQDVIVDKIVFSTFHQIKGLERAIVMIYHFDMSYVQYYMRTDTVSSCPNPIYVAVTRAIKILCLIHHHDNDYFPNISINKLGLTAKVVGKCKFKNKQNTRVKSGNVTARVCDLIKHINTSSLQHMLTFINYEKTICNDGDKIINNKSTNESVIDIYNICILFMYEYINSKCMYVCDYIMEKSKKVPSNHKQRVATAIDKLKSNKGLCIDDIYIDCMYLSNVYNAIMSGYIHKLEQINDYEKWVDLNLIRNSINKLRKHISISATFKKCVSNTLNNIVISGHIDCCWKNNVYMIKCMDVIKYEHIIELALYAWITDNNKEINYCIYNVPTNELLKITNINDIDNLVEYVITCRGGDDNMSDETFIENINK
jgi:hypothetical protein